MSNFITNGIENQINQLYEYKDTDILKDNDDFMKDVINLITPRNRNTHDFDNYIVKTMSTNASM